MEICYINPVSPFVDYNKLSATAQKKDFCIAGKKARATGKGCAIETMKATAKGKRNVWRSTAIQKNFDIIKESVNWKKFCL